MPNGSLQTPLNEALIKVTQEANGIFAQLKEATEKQVEEGVTTIDVLEAARAAGLQLEEADLKEIQLDRYILVHPWLSWCCWFPWRPLWCWWWHRYHPWYYCCRWWWHRCHYHVHHCH